MFRDAVSDSVNTFFTTAKNWVARRDPLVLDLDGGGITTSAIDPNAPIYFDQNGDGIRTATGWIGAGEALVVRDLNGNGLIDSGRELFGDSTVLTHAATVGQTAANGFAALADLDRDASGAADGKFDSQDAAFDSVRLWQDVNQDGISQAGELHTFAELGIASISVTGAAGRIDLGGGNTQALSGSFIRSDGETGSSGTVSLAGSLLLANNNFYRQFTDNPAVTAQAAALPQMQGSGAVRDLREAMSLDTAQAQALQGAVAAFSAATTKDAQWAALDGVIQSWGATSSMLTSIDVVTMPSSYMGNNWNNPNVPRFSEITTIQVFAQASPDLYAKWLALERFNGDLIISQFVGTRIVSNDNAWITDVLASAPQRGLLDQAYAALKESVYGALVVQTRLKPYLDSIELVIDADGIRFDTSALGARLEACRAAGLKNAVGDLVDLNRYVPTVLQASGFDSKQMLDSWVDTIDKMSSQNDIDWSSTNTATSGVDFYLGSSSSDSINTQSGDDFIWGGAGNDILNGGDGDDTLNGGDGDDTLTDSSGANTLRGGLGSDTLTGTGTFEGGQGDDQLNASNSWFSDTYLFNAGDGRDTIAEYGVSGRDDTLRFGTGIAASAVSLARSGNDMVFKVSETDQVTVKDWFEGNPYYIEHVQFADGTQWDVAALEAMTPEVYNATPAGDTLMGWSGIDNIDGQAGNDRINGYGGNDILNGGAGNDSLDGDAGDDILDGGDGDDSLMDMYGANTLRGGLGSGTFEGGQGDDQLNASNSWSSDTYLFNAGDGRDTIAEYGVSGRDDTLRFGADIAPSAVSLARSGSDMVFKVSETDQVTVKDWFEGNPYYIEQVQFADGTRWDMAALEAMTPEVYNATPAGDTLMGWSGIDNIDGQAGNDRINGYGGNDILNGGAGNDSLDGDAGDDMLDGGDGDDSLMDMYGTNTLRGGLGNDTVTGSGTFEGGQGDDQLNASNSWFSDTYLFNAGDGRDTIAEYGVSGRDDTLRFGAGIAPSAVSLARSGSDMVFKVSETDQVTVKDWFDGNPYYIEQVQFADGTRWDVAAITANVLTDLNGTASADTLNGTASSDNIIGLAGNDILNGLAGNDRLDGGSGNDTYVLGHDYDADTVQENDATAGNTDVLQFLDGIASDQIWLRQVSSNLEVSIIGTTDTATLTNWYLGSQYHVEQFKTSDGKTLLDSNVQNLVSAMAAFAPPAAGQTTLSASYQSTLNPVIAASWQ